MHLVTISSKSDFSLQLVPLKNASGCMYAVEKHVISAFRGKAGGRKEEEVSTAEEKDTPLTGPGSGDSGRPMTPCY